MSRPLPHADYDMIISRGFRWPVDSPYALDWFEEMGEMPRQFRWYINDRPATATENDDFDDYFARTPRLFVSPSPWCPFCEDFTEQVYFADDDIAPDQLPSFGREYSMASCPHCGYWAFEAIEGSKNCWKVPAFVGATSVARKFDTSIPDACAAEVAQQIRRDPSFWHAMAPRDMERFVADIFRANYRHAEVFHVGKPGDLGIDVLFVDAGGEDWLVQVKRRESPDAVEGFDTLQRLLGTLVLEGKLRGIIATTAERFSQSLFRQKARAEQRGFKIELLDRGKLDRMLNPVLPVRPWLKLLDGDSLSLFDDGVRSHFISNTSDPRQLRLC